MVKSPTLADDITQDVFIRIWELRESLDVDKKFESFLFTITRNHILNLLKRSSVDAIVLEEIFSKAPQNDNSTEEEVHFTQTSELLHKAIALLPPQQKRIFELCKINGLSYEEAASELNVSPGTINAHIVKSLKFVREYFRSQKGFSILLLLLQSF